MSFDLSESLWTPQRRGLDETISLLESGKDVCLYAPTGGGKTTQAYELLRYCQYHGYSANFYVNRKLLIGQTAKRFRDGGLSVGVRAAEYDDEYDNEAQFQICSADTERSRVIKSKLWDFSPAQLVIIDEAHIQKTETMKEIMAHYRSKGARIVGLTATPVGLSSWFDELVVSGRIREYHDCKALVPAYVYGISEPDMRRVKRNLTGEFVLDGKKTKVYVQSIVADVISSWKSLNPDARPTMLFAPGKDESVWFAEQFEKIGVRWCHVDATDAVLFGKRYKLNKKLWFEIQELYKSGAIKGLSSRFKLREGVDLPCTYHAILATPIGSLASYIQTVGRVLRYSPETPEKVIIQDHGGNYHRLGSPNQDRPWKDFWRIPEHAVSTSMHEGIRDGKEKEPIRCPKCGMERLSGINCPGCGFAHEKGRRRVIMEDGSLKEIEGRMIRPKHVKMTSDTQEKWTRLYFAYRRKGLDKSFKQMLGFFVHEHGYHPPLNLDYMPKNDFDWYAKVKNIGPELLIDSKRSSRIEV